MFFFSCSHSSRRHGDLFNTGDQNSLHCHTHTRYLSFHTSKYTPLSSPAADDGSNALSIKPIRNMKNMSVPSWSFLVFGKISGPKILHYRKVRGQNESVHILVASVCFSLFGFRSNDGKYSSVLPTLQKEFKKRLFLVSTRPQKATSIKVD